MASAVVFLDTNHSLPTTFQSETKLLTTVTKKYVAGSTEFEQLAVHSLPLSADMPNTIDLIEFIRCTG